MGAKRPWKRWVDGVFMIECMYRNIEISRIVESLSQGPFYLTCPPSPVFLEGD